MVSQFVVYRLEIVYIEIRQTVTAAVPAGLVEFLDSQVVKSARVGQPR